ncbi:MAG: cellulase family glycosylhydrolase [Planctomycetes bacterium]|nr:cellulase family glycosylhydrolase [Planctomycetota bacterium]
MVRIMISRRLIFAAMVVIAIGLSMTSSAAERSKMQLIVVSDDGEGFAECDSRRPYIPFGTNYYDPHTGWAPKIWRKFDADKVREHFRLMSEIGVNCARVFLTAASFQPDVGTINEQSLKKLDTLIKIAYETDIRLILTGPDHWEGSPSYWRPDRFAGEEALRALEHFWKVLGQRYEGEPAIFAWDLLNEPHLPWFVKGWDVRWNAWLKKKYTNWDKLKAAWSKELTESDKWGEVAVPENRDETGNPRLRDWQLFREYLADEWVRRQVVALHVADSTHLITVGYIQWSYPLVRPGSPSRYSAFNPHRQKHWLDFVTIHFYPTMGAPFASNENQRKNLSYLQTVLAYCHIGKPVVLGEYGWYGGGAPQKHPYLSETEQTLWISAEIEVSRSLADGWLSWPFADSPSSTDISLFAGLVKSDFTVKAWGQRFKELSVNLSELKRPTPKLPAFDFPKALTADKEELGQIHRAYVEAVEKIAGKPRSMKETSRDKKVRQ